MYVIIVGLGCEQENEICFLTGEAATGYVDIGNFEMTPCRLSILGPGGIGQKVWVPSEYWPRLEQAQKELGHAS